jgi:hypothetical protein
MSDYLRVKKTPCLVLERPGIAPMSVLQPARSTSALRPPPPSPAYRPQPITTASGHHDRSQHPLLPPGKAALQPLAPPGAPRVYRPQAGTVLLKPRPAAPPIYCPVPPSQPVQRTPLAGLAANRPSAAPWKAADELRQPVLSGAPPVYRPQAGTVLPKFRAAAPPIYRPASPVQPVRVYAGGQAVRPGAPAFVAQAKLNALGPHKICGPLAATSATLPGFLDDEEINNLFFAEDKPALVALHKEVVEASAAHKKSKGATTGNLLQKKHGHLVMATKEKAVSPGCKNWEALLQAALDVIVPQPGGKFIQKNAKDAAGQVWPTDRLGSVPEDFWKQVLKSAKPKPAPKTPTPLPLEVAAVLTHAQQRFHAWVSGQEWNRGAWYGSDTHGDKPGNYEGVSPQLATLLELNLPHEQWRFTKSISSEEGISLHKFGGNTKGQDFIYHL